MNGTCATRIPKTISYSLKMPKPHCYRCDSVATSREHVPPRNLFPETRETAGVDHRINLITVPSCDAHNSAKSNDDEFMMVSLAGIIGNNSVGYSHRLGKVNRAILASANHLLDQVLLEKQDVHRVKVTDNQFIEVIWGTPDVVRLNRCFEHIAFGLHRHHFKRSFRGSVKVLLGYLIEREHNKRQFVRWVQDRAELDLLGKPRLGSNPAVFYYQVSEPDQFGLYLIRLCFYGGLMVYTAFTPEQSSPPGNLIGSLIECGIRTVVTLGDKAYEFNPEVES
jgi:hypothetical protein